VENLQPFAAIIVIVLLSLGGYYGWKQVRALRRVRGQRDLPPVDRRYHYTQALLRLVSCALLVTLAALIGGSYLVGLERQADQLARQRDAEAAEGERQRPDPEQQRFMNRYAALWSAVLVVLMLLLFLTAYDLWAIRRYGLRHLRQIQADRQAMIEQEISIIRTQRNGHT